MPQATVSEHRACQPVPLAIGPAARVEQCRCCGTITVHLGVLSFRVDPEVLASLWMTLGEALGHRQGRA